MFDAERLLENIATASQKAEIIEDSVIAGVILRSIVQFIELNPDLSKDGLIEVLKDNDRYNM